MLFSETFYFYDPRADPSHVIMRFWVVGASPPSLSIMLPPFFFGTPLTERARVP